MLILTWNEESVQYLSSLLIPMGERKAESAMMASIIAMLKKVER